MQLLVFTTVGLVAYIVSYAFGLGGAQAGMIFLLILFIGVTLRIAEPLRERLRP